MSTVVEIERAIEKLPTEQQEELRRWMDTRLTKSISQTRSEDWTLPSVDGGGIKIPLDQLHRLAADDEAARGQR